jgi:hypothetical protein
MNPYLIRALGAALAGGALYPSDADAASPMAQGAGRGVERLFEAWAKSRGYQPRTSTFENPYSLMVEGTAKDPATGLTVMELKRLIQDRDNGVVATLFRHDNPTFGTPNYTRTGFLGEGSYTSEEAKQFARRKIPVEVDDATKIREKGKTTADIFRRDYSPYGEVTNPSPDFYRFNPKEVGAYVPQSKLIDTIGGYLMGKPLGMGGIFGALALPLMAKQFSEKGNYPTWY